MPSNYTDATLQVVITELDDGFLASASLSKPEDEPEIVLDEVVGSFQSAQMMIDELIRHHSLLKKQVKYLYNLSEGIVTKVPLRLKPKAL